VLINPGDDNVEMGGWGADSSWHIYVRGYFSAARALIEGPPDKFFLTFAIYPVLFLYRHYVELELKGLMLDFSKVLGRPHRDFGNQHDILVLWRWLLEVVPAGHRALENAANVERILTELRALDPKSMDSRYGLRRDLQSSMPQKMVFSVSTLLTRWTIWITSFI
jgi:hypothetical protein